MNENEVVFSSEHLTGMDDGSEMALTKDNKCVVESLEQKVHALDGKLRQMKVERDNIMTENEELQEQLDASNSAQSAGNVRVSELRNEVIKFTEDITRLEYACTSQEHELKTVSDKVCDLNNLKETVKELQEDTQQFKEDFSRMRTHLNVAAKLELQTQEKMYESRLHHLENVLEEMKQREGHFMRLAEETAVLKDQVDSLRELSVMSLKHEEKHAEVSSNHDDENVKARAAQYAALMESCSGSSLPHMLLANSPTAMSDENNLADEIEKSNSIRMHDRAQIDTPVEPSTHPGDNANDVENESEEPEFLEDLKTEYDSAKLMLLDVEEKPHVKVSGTLRLRSRDPLTERRNKTDEVGCFPDVIMSVWSSVFD